MGTITVRQSLLRAVPASVTEQRFTGFADAETVVYGPEQRSKATVVTLEDVPVTVKTLQIEYFSNATLIGIGAVPVDLTAGETLEVIDPPFQDVTLSVTLESLQISPGSARSAPGSTRQLKALATYSDGSQADVTSQVQWTTNLTGVTVDQVSLGNQITGLLRVDESVQTGQVATVTAALGSVQDSASVRIDLFAYASANSPLSVSAFSVGSTGALSVIAQLDVGSNATEVVVHPNGLFLYLLTSGTGYVYSIENDGSLNQVQSISIENDPSALVIHPQGERAYLTTRAGSSVFSYGIGEDGTLTESGSSQESFEAYDAVLGPNGDFLFLVSRDDELVTLELPGDGSVSVSSRVDVPRNSFRLALHPDQDYLYMASGENSVEGGITTYSVAGDGSLTSRGFEEVIDFVPNGIVSHPSGNTLYAVDTFGGGVFTFSIQPDGTTSFVETAASGGSPFDITLDPAGRFAYVANFSGPGRIGSYTVESDETLDPLGEFENNRSSSVVTTP